MWGMLLARKGPHREDTRAALTRLERIGARIGDAYALPR
jgi:hypothetical protein